MTFVRCQDKVDGLLVKTNSTVYPWVPGGPRVSACTRVGGCVAAVARDGAIAPSPDGWLVRRAWEKNCTPLFLPLHHLKPKSVTRPRCGGEKISITSRCSRAVGHRRRPQVRSTYVTDQWIVYKIRNDLEQSEVASVSHNVSRQEGPRDR